MTVPLTIFVKQLGGNMGLGSNQLRQIGFRVQSPFFTLMGAALNFVGINFMKALVIARIAQGFRRRRSCC
jgi:hypothetical protein